MTDDLKSIFLEGTMDNLNELEQALLKLSSNTDNRDEIDRVFRVMHTIKGSAAMVGIEDVSEFAHKLENEFQHVRAGEAPVTKALVDCSLAARDQLLAMIEGHFDGDKADKSRCEEILSGIRNETQGRHEIQAQKKKCLMNDRLNALEASLESWIESQPINAAMSQYWSEALETAKSCGMECLAEFLIGFESFFSMLAKHGDRLPAGALWLGRGAVAEARKMLADLDAADDVPIDSADVIASLKNALELRAELDRLSAECLSCGESGELNHFRIRITTSEEIYSENVGAFLLDKLRNHGLCTVLKVGQDDTQKTQQELAAG